MEISIVVQGLFEKSDSIGFDAIFQYRELVEKYGRNSVSIFAETYDKSLYPDVDIQSYDKLADHCRKTGSTLIYHYCDGWAEFDAFLMGYEARAILRWHNNTPPWFFASNSNSLDRTVRGYENIVSFSARRDTEFWVNSEFTKRQMEVLGFDDDLISVVYPASRYLKPVDPAEAVRRPRRPRKADDSLRLLFVGRVVEHKGHAHIISCARLLKEAGQRNVIVDFAGRTNPSAHDFNEFLGNFAESSGVTVNLHGEVTEEQLLSLYENADVFMCLSEHEGFGLPVFEAMRCQLPVVAWRSTAFRDLLAEHPCAVDKFSIPAFVAAIEMLQDGEVADCVLDVQESLLEKYTIDIVREQMFAPLETRAATWGVSIDARPLPDGFAERFAKCVTKYSAHLRENGEFLRGIPHEHNINYVTLYDVTAYRTLLSSSSEMAFSSVEASDGVFGKARLPVSEFSYHDINPVAGGYMMFGPGIAGDETVVFGPYRMLNPGFYRVGMGLKYVGADENFAAVQLVVETKNGDKLVEKEVILAQLQRNAFVDFHVDGEHADIEIEFKVKTKDKARGVLFFHGADVIKLPTPFDDMFTDIDLDAILGMAAFDYSAVIGSADRRRTYEREILVRERKIEWLTGVLQVVLNPKPSFGTRVAGVFNGERLCEATREALRAKGLFDAEQYYALNFDVAQSGQDALMHYVSHGLAEKRQFRTAWKDLLSDDGGRPSEA